MNTSERIEKHWRHETMTKSTGTVGTYKTVIKVFLRWCEAHGITDISQLTEDMLEEYAISLLKKSTFTRRMYIQVIGAFLKDIGIEVHMPDKPKAVASKVKYLTRDEMKKVMDIVRRNRRKHSILMLLYGSGLRASELCSLRVGDLDVQGGTLSVMGKGSKPRLVPVLPEAIEVVKRYLKMRQQDSQWLICNRFGQPMERRNLWLIIDKISKRAKLGKHISPHMFRHSFATHLAESGVNSKVLQVAMGHANLATTEKYMHVSPEAMVNDIQNRFPKGGL
jgi:integrase/recombinase XerD